MKYILQHWDYFNALISVWIYKLIEIRDVLTDTYNIRLWELEPETSSSEFLSLKVRVIHRTLYYQKVNSFGKRQLLYTGDPNEAMKFGFFFAILFYYILRWENNDPDLEYGIVPFRESSFLDFVHNGERTPDQLTGPANETTH